MRCPCQWPCPQESSAAGRQDRLRQAGGLPAMWQPTAYIASTILPLHPLASQQRAHHPLQSCPQLDVLAVWVPVAGLPGGPFPPASPAPPAAPPPVAGAPLPLPACKQGNR